MKYKQSYTSVLFWNCFETIVVIFRRINYDVLELVEHSLDINLTGNRVRYKFSDTPILDGVSIHETYENVVVLVPTVCSVHKLLFPHPDKFHRQVIAYILFSIFTKVIV